MAVVVETTIGDFTIDLFTEERPRTCTNFLKLCKRKYYNLNLLYSVERNFLAQTGDPTGTGRGGDSIFKEMFGEQARLYEGEKLPLLRHTHLGTVSMVAYGDNMYGSQFFVTLGEDLHSLDSEHLVFGQVTEGLDVIAKLNDVLTDDKNRPYQDIRITHTVVLEDPFPDPEEVEFPDASPEPTAEMLASDYIAVHEDIEDTAGKDIKEIEEEIAQKEAQARATILEMVGDLPDAEMAPPENVLFVCKLNPVTTSEDLEIIFSRFGKIVCTEVIRDHVTGKSLQYAFIEFEDKKSCEDAYFKMDNVLIDDRRIHVDFSQSVSKVKWRGKGRGVMHFDDKGRRVEPENRRPKNDGQEKPKSRFIDVAAYQKKYQEEQERKGFRRRDNERGGATSRHSDDRGHRHSDRSGRSISDRNDRPYSDRNDRSTSDRNGRHTNDGRDRQVDRRDLYERDRNDRYERDRNDRHFDRNTSYRDRRQETESRDRRTTDRRDGVQNHPRHAVRKRPSSPLSDDEEDGERSQRRDLIGHLRSDLRRDEVVPTKKKKLSHESSDSSDSSADKKLKKKKKKKKGKSKKEKHSSSESSDSDSDEPSVKKKKSAKKKKKRESSSSSSDSERETKDKKKKKKKKKKKH